LQGHKAAESDVKVEIESREYNAKEHLFSLNELGKFPNKTLRCIGSGGWMKDGKFCTRVPSIDNALHLVLKDVLAGVLAATRLGTRIDSAEPSKSRGLTSQ
jgi:hypothetical protein